jgi:hypothetical protein
VVGVIKFDLTAGPEVHLAKKRGGENSERPYSPQAEAEHGQPLRYGHNVTVIHHSFHLIHAILRGVVEVQIYTSSFPLWACTTFDFMAGP